MGRGGGLRQGHEGKQGKEQGMRQEREGYAEDADDEMSSPHLPFSTPFNPPNHPRNPSPLKHPHISTGPPFGSSILDEAVFGFADGSRDGRGRGIVKSGNSDGKTGFDFDFSFKLPYPPALPGSSTLTGHSQSHTTNTLGLLSHPHPQSSNFFSSSYYSKAKPKSNRRLLLPPTALPLAMKNQIDPRSQPRTKHGKYLSSREDFNGNPVASPGHVVSPRARSSRMAVDVRAGFAEGLMADLGGERRSVLGKRERKGRGGEDELGSGSEDVDTGMDAAVKTSVPDVACQGLHFPNQRLSTSNPRYAQHTEYSSSIIHHNHTTQPPNNYQVGLPLDVDTLSKKMDQDDLDMDLDVPLLVSVPVVRKLDFESSGQRADDFAVEAGLDAGMDIDIDMSTSSMSTTVPPGSHMTQLPGQATGSNPEQMRALQVQQQGRSRLQQQQHQQHQHQRQRQLQTSGSGLLDRLSSTSARASVNGDIVQTRSSSTVLGPRLSRNSINNHDHQDLPTTAASQAGTRTRRTLLGDTSSLGRIEGRGGQRRGGGIGAMRGGSMRSATTTSMTSETGLYSSRSMIENRTPSVASLQSLQTPATQRSSSPAMTAPPLPRQRRTSSIVMAGQNASRRNSVAGVIEEDQDQQQQQQRRSGRSSQSSSRRRNALGEMPVSGMVRSNSIIVPAGQDVDIPDLSRSPDTAPSSDFALSVQMMTGQIQQEGQNSDDDRLAAEMNGIYLTPPRKSVMPGAGVSPHTIMDMQDSDDGGRATSDWEQELSLRTGKQDQASFHLASPPAKLYGFSSPGSPSDPYSQAENHDLWRKKKYAATKKLEGKRKKRTLLPDDKGTFMGLKSGRQTALKRQKGVDYTIHAGTIVHVELRSRALQESVQGFEPKDHNMQ